MALIPPEYVGHVAGLTTSVLWTFTSLFFTAASRRIGPTRVNGIRLLTAVVLLGVTHRLLSTSHTWFPQLLGEQVVLLAASGLLGLVIGDQAMLTAFLAIGPRLTLLMSTSAPLFATLFGWLFLDETVGWRAGLGITCTITGIAWVVLERPRDGGPAFAGHRARGLALALLSAAAQAGGLLLSKAGMGHGWLPRAQHLDPQGATLTRAFFAGAAMVLILLLHAWRERTRSIAAHPRGPQGAWRAGVLLALGGAVVGPYLGVWLSLIASDRAPLGVAQTLVALPPVLILPIVRLVHQEPLSARAVCGALLAVGGVAMLFVHA